MRFWMVQISLKISELDAAPMVKSLLIDPESTELSSAWWFSVSASDLYL